MSADVSSVSPSLESDVLFSQSMVEHLLKLVIGRFVSCCENSGFLFPSMCTVCLSH